VSKTEIGIVELNCEEFLNFGGRSGLFLILDESRIVFMPSVALVV
jgi:hypothetical protein